MKNNGFFVPFDPGQYKTIDTKKNNPTFFAAHIDNGRIMMYNIL